MKTTIKWEGIQKMIERRFFLRLSSILGVSVYLPAKQTHHFEKDFKEILPTIVGVQMHMFPKESKLSIQSAMHMTKFMADTLTHKSFDKDIRKFILEGAEVFMRREKVIFASLSVQKREEALRAYESTSYGKAWLSRILTMGLEGTLSDPLYGENREEKGWKALATFGGMPRPQRRYIDV